MGNDDSGLPWSWSAFVSEILKGIPPDVPDRLIVFGGINNLKDRREAVFCFVFDGRSAVARRWRVFTARGLRRRNRQRSCPQCRFPCGEQRTPAGPSAKMVALKTFPGSPFCASGNFDRRLRWNEIVQNLWIKSDDARFAQVACR